mgnify:CR=1 FL=1
MRILRKGETIVQDGKKFKNATLSPKWQYLLKPKALPTITIGKKTYFVDERLDEIRNVKNPHDAESVSPEIIHIWKKLKWLEYKKVI